MTWPLLVAGLLAAAGCQLAAFPSPPPAPDVAPVAAAPVLVQAVLECEIKGLADYGTVDLQVGACSASVYLRACREAQHVHRERCQEFCAALKAIGGRGACTGRSSPVARLFDPDRHCRELRQDQFEVSCEVRSDCSCSAGTSAEG